MKDFAYAEPQTEAEVLLHLADQPGQVELLAGGTDLVGLMKKMIVTPDLVVNLMEVPTLRGIEPLADGGLSIGATTRLDEVLDSPYLEDYPAVLQAIRGINSMQLQCQGTLGGEICQRPQCWYFRQGSGLLSEHGQVAAAGDNRFHAILGNAGPAKFVNSSRIAPALIALGANLRVLGPGAEEETIMPVADLYRTPRHEGQRELTLLPRQFVTHILLPPVKAPNSGTYEVRHSAGPDYPLAAAAAALELDGGMVKSARVVLGQVAPTPWVSEEAARTIIGLPVTQATAAAAGAAAVAGAAPLSHNAYKVDLARVAVKRAILLAAGLETGGF